MLKTFNIIMLIAFIVLVFSCESDLGIHGGSGSDGDADGDSDGDSDGDADGDTDGDTDADSDSDTDTDTDGDSDDDTEEDVDCIDEDEDWWCVEHDCDDNDPLINPDADDIPENGIDENCDGEDGFIDTESDPDYCGFVDILFIIDNSVSMMGPQENLANAFPAFVDVMFDVLQPNTDLHVGVTTSSFTSQGVMDTTMSCRSTSTPPVLEIYYDRPTDVNNGENGGQGRLLEWDGMPYFAANTNDDPDALKDWFQGAATAAGESGSNAEMHAAGAGWAAHEANQGTNAGFFRDEDAALVLFFLADEPDKSLDPISDYYDWIVAKKDLCGGDKCIMTAGIIHPCVVDTNDYFWQFMNAFGDDDEPVLWGDINDPSSYEDVVADALGE